MNSYSSLTETNLSSSRSSFPISKMEMTETMEMNKIHTLHRACGIHRGLVEDHPSSLFLSLEAGGIKEKQNSIQQICAYPLW